MESEHAPAPEQAKTNESGMAPSPIGALAFLLGKLFSSASKISAFARSYNGLEVVAKDLPGDNVPAAEMASALASCLREHGLVKPEFFMELIRLRPFNVSEIRLAAEVWGIKFSPRSDALATKPRRSAFFFVAGAAGFASIAAFILYALIHNETPQRLSFSEDGSPPMVSVSSMNSMGRYVPFLGQEVIAIDPPFPTSVTLKVISTTTGKSWRVSISRFRSAESAARAIFARLHLKGDPDIAAMFLSGKFELCVAGRCHGDDLLQDFVSPEQEVAVKLNGYQCSDYCGPPLSEVDQEIQQDRPRFEELLAGDLSPEERLEEAVTQDIIRQLTIFW